VSKVLELYSNEKQASACLFVLIFRKIFACLIARKELLFISLGQYGQDNRLGVWEILIIVTIFAWPIYLFLAMKRFYRQNGGKIFIKFALFKYHRYCLISDIIDVLFTFFCFSTLTNKSNE
jgi:hypothetical protein